MKRPRDQGAVAVYFAVLAPCWLAILGLIVVGGAKVREYQRADNIASEAARAAGSAIDPTTAIPGGLKRIDPVRAAAAVEDYLRLFREATGTTVSATIAVDPAGQRVTVTTRTEFVNPTRIEYFGGGAWQATGQATATILTG